MSPVGLWAIYGTPSNNTAVMKVDPETMTAQYAWDITVNHHNYGEMFVARGVLYAVHSISESTMNIRYINLLILHLSLFIFIKAVDLNNFKLQ